MVVHTFWSQATIPAFDRCIGFQLLAKYVTYAVRIHLSVAQVMVVNGSSLERNVAVKVGREVLISPWP